LSRPSGGTTWRCHGLLPTMGGGEIVIRLLMQPFQRLHQGLRRRIGVEADDAQQRRQEP
jgi:hypothetical protein